MVLTRRLVLEISAVAVVVSLLVGGGAAAAAAASRLEDGHVRVPGQRSIHSACLHTVPAGGRVVRNEEIGTMDVYDADGDLTDRVGVCRHGPTRMVAAADAGSVAVAEGAPAAVEADGWQTYVAANNAGNQTFESFTGFFSVPEGPAQWPKGDDGILYIFPGLQSDNWIPNGAPPFSNVPALFEITQPVFQWGGDSSNGGGAFWSMASWYVTVDHGGFVTPMVNVTVGENIQFKIARLSGDDWIVSGFDPKKPSVNATFAITKPALASQPWAYCVLEVYGITSCDYLPASASVFTEMGLVGADNKPFEAAWDIVKGGTAPCPVTTEVVSAAAVSLPVPDHPVDRRR